MRNVKVSLTIASEVLSTKQVTQVVTRQIQSDEVSAKRQVTTSRELGLGITATPGDEDVCRCSLPWREATSLLERWMLPRRHTNATKAHPILPLRQHHEGASQPLVVDLGVVSKPSQTFPGVITTVDSSPKDSYRLGVSNLQE